MRQNRQFSRLRHHLPPTPRPRIRRPQVQRLRQSLNESQSLQSLAQTLAVVLTRLGSGIAPSPRNERKIRILPTELGGLAAGAGDSFRTEGVDVVAGLFPDSEAVRQTAAPPTQPRGHASPTDGTVFNQFHRGQGGEKMQRVVAIQLAIA